MRRKEGGEQGQIDGAGLLVSWQSKSWRRGTGRRAGCSGDGPVPRVGTGAAPEHHQGL